MDLKEEDILGEKIYDHWYYVSKGKALTRILKPFGPVEQVLDVGAGSGIFSKQLLDQGLAQSAICVDPNYSAVGSEAYNGKSISFTRSIAETTQKLVLMMDVLEHVEDDVALVRAYADTMPSDGMVLITVPAFNFLWSGHDVFLEHYRRYTVQSLRRTIKDAGLVVETSRYFFGALFPLIAAVRVRNRFSKGAVAETAKSDLVLYPDWLNRLLIFVHVLERVTIFPVNQLAGLSLFALCRKP